MAPPVTESVLIKLHNAEALQDPSSKESQVLKETVTIISQQEGYIRSYWGPIVEDPTSWAGFIGTYMSIHVHTYLPPPPIDLTY